MTPFEIDDEGRAAYHAAASTASNFLVTLQAAAEAIARGAGLGREDARALLMPLVRQTVENVAELGPEAALTGPIARGDEATVEAQRAAVEETAPSCSSCSTSSSATRARSRPGGTGMRTVRTVAELREVLASERRAGRSIGLVPTMGYFHDGHLSLMRQARAQNDVLVVSLFVNPAQFGPGEDLEAYPRDEERDTRLAEARGSTCCSRRRWRRSTRTASPRP